MPILAFRDDWSGNVARVLTNCVVYFVVVPTAYIGGILWTEPQQRKDGIWNVFLYVYTSPIWPVVMLVVPLLALVARATRAWSDRSRRAALVATGLATLGLCAAFAFRDGRWITALSAGGAFFGALYREGRSSDARPLP